MIANSVSYDLPLRYKSARRATEKERIARAAAALVAPGAVVGLNGGPAEASGVPTPDSARTHQGTAEYGEARR